MTRILTVRMALVLSLCMVALALAIAGCRSGVREGDPADPDSGGVAGARAEAVKLTDVTMAAGIRFQHQNGAVGRKYMPETMGSGCAFLDYDNDGWQDVLLISGQPWSRTGRGGKSSLVLYRNDGAGHFQDVTSAVGLDAAMYGMGVAVGDWDNDGFDDLAVTALGGVYLYRNRMGRRFELISNSEQAASPTDRSHGSREQPPSQAPTLPGGWPTSAAWVDYDRDGWLDLFVCHYVRWSPATDVFWSLDGIHKSYTTPEKYEGESCRLYHNAGGRRFKDVTQQAGMLSSRSKALGVAICDYDLDGWPDILVSNDTEPTLVYHNQGDGTFHEVATELGVAVAESGKPKAGMGIDTGDDRNTGSEALLLTNFAGEQISLYRKDATGQFLDDAASAGVGLPSQRYLGFGAFFFDADLDGSLDILVSNGHVMDDIERRNTGVTYAEPALLFLNDGGGKYRAVGAAAGPALSMPQVGRGAACGDYDNDGDLDVLLTSNGGPARLLRNDGGSKHGWLKLQLEGRPSNRDAIGARVQVWAGSSMMSRTVKSGSSYLSSSDHRLTFGLGEAPRADRIEIQWPSGAVQSLPPVERDRWLRIREGRPGSVAAAR